MDLIEQKAKELIDKFYDVVDDNRFSSRDWGKATAKQCAIICVEEIMFYLESKLSALDYVYHKKYCQQVKERLLAKQ